MGFIVNQKLNKSADRDPGRSTGSITEKELQQMYLHYYVYAYIRKSDNTPYYIGKGKGCRAWSKQHNVSVPKDKSKILILESNLSNVGACALERRYIKWYGRKDLNTGILYNRTDGGEGCAGAKLSESHKNKIKQFWAGKPKPWAKRPGELNTFYGKCHSTETKIKQSTVKQGLNNPMFGRKQSLIKCPHCSRDIPANVYPRFHGINCKSRIN